MEDGEKAASGPAEEARSVHREKSENQRRAEAERTAYLFRGTGAELARERKAAFLESRARRHQQQAIDAADDEEAAAPVGAEDAAAGDDAFEVDKRTRRVEHVKGEEDDRDELPRFEGEVKLDPFNLRAEREEGFFDSAGNYVEHKLPRRLRDAWLEEYDDKMAADMEKEADELENKWRKGIEAEDQREEEGKVEEAALNTNASKRRLLETAVSLMNAGESTAGALRRLAEKKTGDRDKFTQLTKCLDALLSCGYVDIYSLKKAALVDLISDLDDSVAARLVDEALTGMEGHRASKKRAEPPGSAPQDSSEPAAKRPRSAIAPGAILWEYTTSKDDTDVQGPFTTEQMAEWRRAGFFVGEFRARVRRVKADSIFEDGADEPWIDSEQVNFDAAARLGK